ncbi:ribokinase [Microvirga solisilvae]|uniref:ribokinase n=1 Tax=Microvirga solisilvae TaxID=2919498 RepID=UPI001FAF5DAE|nr:ribokinase [Microvirga solisilvae]
MITVFGSINMDLVARVLAIAKPGETVLSRRADSFFGGKGANQAVAAARVSGGRIAVAMAGAIGDDAFGKACRDNLAANGVDVDGIRIADEPTGCAFITVDERGENAITVASGANMAVHTAQVPGEILAKTSILVLQMEVPLAENIAVARWAKQMSARVIWNAAPVPAGAEKGAVADMLAVTDLLVVNEHEAITVAAMIGDNAGGDYLVAASRLAHTYSLTCIVTAGAKGAFAVDADGTQIHAAAPPVTPVDTTGAGDTFVGVLAYGLAEGRELQDAMQRACIAASLSCLTAGAQAGMPSRDRLEATLSA